jgi:tetratricopeptide (TPR) repeat protein
MEMTNSEMTEEEDRFERGLIDRALQARHEGRIDDALALCEEALARLPSDRHRRRALVHCEMGNLFKNYLGDLGRAAEHFRESTKLAPRAELPSLGLFHVLFKLGQLTEALREIVRFVSLKDSAEYRELLNGGGYRSELEPEDRALADEARARLNRWC